GNPSFRELLIKVKRAALESYGYQDLPFEKLVEEIQPERNLGSSPLFQVMFALQNFPKNEFAVRGLSVSPIELHPRTAKFDLSLALTETADGLEGGIEYCADLFDAATICRMTGHFRTLLEGVVTTPEQRVRALPLLTEAEKHQLLVEWNDTEKDYPAGKCVHQFFEDQVERTPGAVALVFEGRQLSYRELNDRINQLAHYLRKRGVGPETLVAICMERSLEMLIGVLGVVKAGGAYVPIDPEFPVDRIKFILQDTQSTLILTQKKFSSILAQFTDRQFCLLDDAGNDLSLESKENPENLVNDQNVAYVIYTSGSTGTPKGVLSIHGGLRNRLQWMQETYGLQSVDRVLQKTPFTFDISVWEFLWPLLNGAVLVIARPGGHRDRRYLVQLIQRERITVLHFVPSMLEVFLQEAG